MAKIRMDKKADFDKKNTKKNRENPLRIHKK